ncbi:YtfJ family protein [Sulfurimonas sp.]|uniref:YtfJ family protein n=1 Tax=Sulfurimonas sp. TaxID=2022749 RepID=UPI0039E30CBC
MKIILFSILVYLNLFAINVGDIPTNITIQGDDGGLVSDEGNSWSSTSIKDKTFVLFYVDPDEKDTNSHFNKLLKAKAFDKNKFASIAIINLAATWKPNFVIESILQTKQEEFPDTIYVKDKASILVKEWQLPDDASNIILFSTHGKVLFFKSGKMENKDIEKFLFLLNKEL